MRSRLPRRPLVADGVDAVFTPTDNTVMKSELTIYETFAEAGIPHYTGADSFALNGAFLGYGVDYANLGVETANMIADILLDGTEPRTTARHDLRQRHRYHQHRDLRSSSAIDFDRAVGDVRSLLHQGAVDRRPPKRSMTCKYIAYRSAAGCGGICIAV